MNGELFTQIAMCIISIIGALISAYLIPYIKTKVATADLERFMEYVKIAVRCANQIFTPEEWKEKKAYVVAQAKAFIENNLKITLTDEQIDTIIEGLVNLTKEEGKK